LLFSLRQSRPFPHEAFESATLRVDALPHSRESALGCNELGSSSPTLELAFGESHRGAGDPLSADERACVLVET